MIKGIGVDIVEIARIEKLMGNKHAQDRLLTDNEVTLMKSRPKPQEFFAGRFAAKEALSKALGVGISKCPPNEVEVLNDKLGAPYIILHGRANKLQNEKGASRIFISITHEKEYAVAMVVLEGEG